ncbi:hypothetical protein SLS60_006199 [Paraconiothyrium brasiliense]|uniref:Uncharacterized protein n=1 Tax=Paraconiothyrium brasiliense TaxID=300254 RepID=A0ABR3RER7_9PLEO
MFFFSKFGFRSSSSSSYGYDPQKTRDEKDLEEHHEQFEQMLKGDCILVQFGENLESMFIKAGDVNPNAKRLMRAIHTYSHRESSIKLAVTLPEVSRLMYETYVTWDMSVEVTALTFRWGKLILLAQTTKLLEDVESHRKTLDSMIAKGEQCKYIKHLLFQPEDWSLLRKTLHAGALCDDPTRKVVAELLKRSDGLKELLCITAKELEQMGITWEETCIVEATVDGIGVEPDVVPKDKKNPVATSNVEYVHNTEVTSIAGHEQAQDDDEWEILSITGSHSDDRSIAWESDDSEDEHLLVTEPAIDADDWIIAPQSPGQVKTESQIDEHGNSSHKYGPKTQIGNNSASGDENASNAPVRSADDIAKHYRGLAADDAAVSVGFGEQQDASQEKDSHDKDGGVVIQQNCVPRYEGASPVESLENPSLSDEMEFPPAKLPGLEAAKCASLERRKLPSPL